MLSAKTLGRVPVTLSYFAYTEDGEPILENGRQKIDRYKMEFRRRREDEAQAAKLDEAVAPETVKLSEQSSVEYLAPLVLSVSGFKDFPGDDGTTLEQRFLKYFSEPDAEDILSQFKLHYHRQVLPADLFRDYTDNSVETPQVQSKSSQIGSGVPLPKVRED